MIWYAIIMSVLFNFSYQRAYFMYDLQGDIYYEQTNGIHHHHKGDVPIPGTEHYEALIGVEDQKGSGLGITPHMWLGPTDGDSGTVSPVSPRNPRKPPTNDGENGNPVIVTPDNPTDPGDTGTPGDCSTIGDIDQYTYGVDNYIIDAVGVNYLGSATMTQARRDKFIIAKDMMKRAILSTNFKTKVLNFTGFCNTTQGSTSLGSDAASVWLKICTGKELWRPTTVSANGVDANQSVYYVNTNTVGYVSSTGGNRIHTNTKYLDAYDPSTTAGHVVHEWSHLLGYSHGDGPSTCESKSTSGDVSYRVGDFFGSVAEPLDADYGW